MSKWGLLKGVGQGVAQAGNLLMADRMDQAKEKRLQKYQQELQNKQFEREDQIRAEDQGIQMQRDAQSQANFAQGRADQQANADRAFGLQEGQAKQSSELISRQMDQIDQEIEINGLALSDQKEIRELRAQVMAETDPVKKGQLYENYRIATGTDKDDKFSLVSAPEYDEDGVRTGTNLYTHNSRTNEIVPYMAGDGPQGRPSLSELLGGAAEGAAQPQGEAPDPASRGLLTPQQPPSPVSNERAAVQQGRDQNLAAVQQERAAEQEQAERDDFDKILGRVNQSNLAGVDGRTAPNAGALRRSVIANQDDLLKIIESPVSTDVQKDQARQLLQTISGR